MKFKFLNSSIIKVWIPILFIIVLLQICGGRPQVDPILTNIIDNESNKIKHVVEKINYHSEFLIDPSQVDSAIINMIDNSKIEVDLILHKFNTTLLDKVKSANNRGVRIRIITKSIYKNIIDDLKKEGIIINYNNNIESGLIYVDKKIGANLISFNNSYLLTIFQDIDSLQRFQILIDEQFLKNRKIF